MEKLYKKYKILFNKLDNNTANEELSHKLQDKIYRTFIKDICNNKFTTLKDIVAMSRYMNDNVVVHDKNRWYS